MAYLSVNIDYVAVVRESRQTDEPDPVIAAGIAALAGAHGITAHLREDRRHIQDRDVRLLRETVTLPFNLEMAATDEMFDIAEDLVPDLVTIVPERRQEITTEGGLDVTANRQRILDGIGRLERRGIQTSLFIDPDPIQIDISKEIGANCVELHTGEYANAVSDEEREYHLNTLVKAARHAVEAGLEVHAGHGLTYRNVTGIAAIHDIGGLYIGHSILSRAVYTGLEQAVKDMIQLIQQV